MVSGYRIPYNFNVRTTFGKLSASIRAWPSRGGVIVLGEAEAMDFEFLGLDPLYPPTERLQDQALEDGYCERLLLLGAKWWDSYARYYFVKYVRELSESGSGATLLIDDSVRDESHPEPTLREKRWVKVGWPSTGGLWVSEFDTTYGGVRESNNLPPLDQEYARLKMARNMDERCRMLQERFRGKFYQDVKRLRGICISASLGMEMDG